MSRRKRTAGRIRGSSGAGTITPPAANNIQDDLNSGGAGVNSDILDDLNSGGAGAGANITDP